jgi:hypothetical protein
MRKTYLKTRIIKNIKLLIQEKLVIISIKKSKLKISVNIAALRITITNLGEISNY